jgi:hypothetical protein
MQKGYKMSRRGSEKYFKATADKTHYFNTQHSATRGGKRL